MLDTFLDTPGAALRYLIGHDAFVVVKPLAVHDFLRYCNDRDIRIDRERLERLERLGIFYPFARVEYPRIKLKIERVGENRARHHGVLRDGEVWTGELRDENSGLSWRRESAQSWIDEGFLWDPRERPFEPWATFAREGEWQPRIESFYTPFQAFVLKGVLTWLTMRVPADVVGPWTDDEIAEFGRTLKDWATSVTNGGSRHRSDDAAFVAQVLCNRYYFLTQSDRRTIRVSEHPFDKWDWAEYARAWDAQVTAKELGLTDNDLAEIHLDVSFLTTSSDPLERWYDLVTFVPVDRREQLKDRARFAQLGYAIETMVRLFYKDVTGKDLRLPNERHAGRHPDDDEDREPLDRELEYTANRFNINPKPKLILVVEGDGEETELPRLALELMGRDFRRLGIDVRNLRGIANFTGAKGRAPYGALEKFIDDHHCRQTIVFCILDREGRAAHVRERLIAADSIFVPGRKLTCDDYIRLWNDSIEFDNFTDEEIAAALTRVAKHAYTFTAAEVATARSAKAKTGNPLHVLYHRALAYDLNKVDLLHELFDRLIANRQAELSASPPRPLVTVLRRTVELAAGNHQPVSTELWVRNQESGYFGAVKPGATITKAK